MSTTSAPATPIPDQGSVSDSVTIDASTGGAPDLALVDLQIDHTWIGDLTVTLTAPSGEETVLIDRPGQSDLAPFGSDADEIDATILITDLFSDEDLNGTWTLTVSDAVQDDTGILEEWSLTLIDVDPVTEPGPDPELPVSPEPVFPGPSPIGFDPVDFTGLDLFA